MSQLLLLLETSTPATSVAIAELRGDAELVLAQAYSAERMRHTALLMPLVQSAFAKTDHAVSDLAAVAVSSGPGSYTALRAGLSTAKGLCLALDVPLIQVSTLEALAQNAAAHDPETSADLLAVIHARRREVYAGRYRRSGVALQEVVAPASALVDGDWLVEQARLGPYTLCGPAAELVSDLTTELRNPSDDRGERARNQRGSPGASGRGGALLAADLLPLAATALRLGRFVDLAAARPSYLKPPFITKPKPRL